MNGRRGVGLGLAYGNWLSLALLVLLPLATMLRRIFVQEAPSSGCRRGGGR